VGERRHRGIVRESYEAEQKEKEPLPPPPERRVRGILEVIAEEKKTHTPYQKEKRGKTS